MVPAIDMSELTLIILSYTQHVAEIATRAQKTSDKNYWSLVQAQAKLKACNEEVMDLKEQLSKKSPSSDETLSPLLERAQKEAELARNQIAHVEAKVRDLQGSREELQASLLRLANGEEKMAHLQEMVQKYKPVKSLISYKDLSDLASSGSDDSKNQRRCHFCH